MRNLLLVGNANTGKTTLFNSLTKSDEHTGNWHGVTVEEKKKNYKFNDEIFGVVDLPGIYSLNAFTMEEQVAIDYIFCHDDLIVNTTDINTLNKNLFLTLDLLSFNKNLILVVNNMGRKNSTIDIKKISRELGVEVVVLDFDSKKDVLKLKEKIFNYNKKNNFNLNKIYSKKTINILNNISNKFNIKITEIIKIMEKNNYFIKKNNKNELFFNFLNNFDEINYLTLAQEKYFFINYLLKINNEKIYGSEILDKILLNKFFAIPIFFAIMLGVFYLTFFSVGAFLSTLLSDLIQVKLGGLVVGWMENFCSISWIVGLIENGLFAGVGSLVAFLPQVVLLFVFLAIMEDSGYFSRIAFMFEDLFNSLGLSGKSVYSLLMGFGCSASAVLTTRAMESRSSKIKTAILTPYMSCSAKIPIYVILGGAFFGAGNVFIIFLLYLLGVLTALFVSILLEKFGLRSSGLPLIMEFPPYRFPKIKKICKIAFFNLKIFFIKISTIFISMSVIIWCLGNFSPTFNYVLVSGEKSMLQILGEFFAPIFAPLGFNSWGAVGALIAGIVAKEIVVGSLAIFNGISGNSTAHISESLKNSSSVVSFTSASALSFMTFCLLYCPCLATMAVLKKEIGLKWTLFAIGLQLIVAYIIAFIVYNLYGLMGSVGVFSMIFLIMGLLGIIFSIFRIFDFLKQKNKCKICGKCKNKA